jgi:hypothetical protein
MQLAFILQPEQRETLGQALADAVYYRDPPVYCPACETLDGLCEDCAAGLARARAYVRLSRELSMPEQTVSPARSAGPARPGSASPIPGRMCRAPGRRG